MERWFGLHSPRKVTHLVEGRKAVQNDQYCML